MCDRSFTFWRNLPTNPTTRWPLLSLDVDCASTISTLVDILGLSPQRPLARAYQRDPEMVDARPREQFPFIQQEAKRLGAHIFFADEANVRSDYHSGATWAPVGQTPVVQRTGARHTLNMISAVSPRGELRFMCHEVKFNAALFIEFMERLLVNRTTPVFLIVDGHPAHRTGLVKQFILVCGRRPGLPPSS